MTLRVGFLGHGFMGRAHANALARLPMFFPDCPAVDRSVLIGVDEDAVAGVVDQLGFTTSATDWRGVLPDIDILCNLAPNHAHVEPSVTALEDGVHVLCEKPLAHTLPAANRMQAAAEASPAVAGVAFNYRFVPAVQYAKRVIEDGELGEIRSVRARYLQDWMADPNVPWSWRTDANRAGSGALADIGSHLVDLARYFAGEITAVSGQLRTAIDTRPAEGTGETKAVEVDDSFTALAQFATDATGVFEASRVSPGHKNGLTMTVEGSTGSLRFDLERLNELEIHREGGRGWERILVTEEADPYLWAWWPPGHVLGWEHSFVHLYRDFLTAVSREEEPLISFADGRATQAVLDAISQSDEAMEWVSVS